jgi:hypothetical protein
MLIYGTHCDPLNILQNGEFTSLGVHFDLYNSLDMIANGINTLIPYYWICSQGGVQVLDPTIYNPPSNANITFIMHMNFYKNTYLALWVCAQIYS